ncbi:hypothetical protein [Dactylosporangium maewongense]|uniref:hypothetical protein n=1 Tax=Dactylosporangium TaxID=35753 RepID=UPI0031CE919E
MTESWSSVPSCSAVSSVSASTDRTATSRAGSFRPARRRQRLGQEPVDRRGHRVQVDGLGEVVQLAAGGHETVGVVADVHRSARHQGEPEAVALEQRNPTGPPGIAACRDTEQFGVDVAGDGGRGPLGRVG